MNHLFNHSTCFGDNLTLLHTEQPKLHIVLVAPSAIEFMVAPSAIGLSIYITTASDMGYSRPGKVPLYNPELLQGCQCFNIGV